MCARYPGADALPACPKLGRALKILTAVASHVDGLSDTMVRADVALTVELADDDAPRNAKREAFEAFAPRAHNLLEGFLRFGGMNAEADRLARPVGGRSRDEGEAPANDPIPAPANDPIPAPANDPQPR